MLEAVKAFYFHFAGRDILKAHLFEHCLGAYFVEHHIPFDKLKTHPLGVYMVLAKDQATPRFPKIPDLEPYLDRQKERLLLEYLEVLDTRFGIIETLHKLYAEDVEHLLENIKGVQQTGDRDLLEYFERILGTKVFIEDLGAELPALASDEAFQPQKREIATPKLNGRLDVFEIAIRLPRSIENMSYLVNLYTQTTGRLRELTVLDGAGYGSSYSIATLQGGYQYLLYSLKAKAGRGEKFLDSVRSLLAEIKFDEMSFAKWRTGMVGRKRRIWCEAKLTDLLVMELIIWRRILKPEDFENLSFEAIQTAHEKVFSKSRDNIYILKDF